MADEEKKVQDPQPKEENLDYKDYINAIDNLKKTTVSREEYDKVVAEKKELIKSLMDGDTIKQEDTTEKVDIDTLRNELYSGKKELTNLEIATKTLKLRNALIEKGERDPFLPASKKYVPTQEDKKRADYVANRIQECIDYADGDSALFTNELQRITVDSQPIVSNNRR